jgi:hypothetical protein
MMAEVLDGGYASFEWNKRIPPGNLLEIMADFYYR